MPYEFQVTEKEDIVRVKFDDIDHLTNKAWKLVNLAIEGKIRFDYQSCGLWIEDRAVCNSIYFISHSHWLETSRRFRNNYHRIVRACKVLEHYGEVISHTISGTGNLKLNIYDYENLEVYDDSESIYSPIEPTIHSNDLDSVAGPQHEPHHKLINFYEYYPVSQDVIVSFTADHRETNYPDASKRECEHCNRLYPISASNHETYAHHRQVVKEQEKINDWVQECIAVEKKEAKFLAYQDNKLKQARQPSEDF